jgi:hypothetical protein
MYPIKGCAQNNLLVSVRSEMVDFGSSQGRSDVESAGVAALRRGIQQSENAGMGQKMPFQNGYV